MLNELLPTDLVNGDGTIKPEAQATILSGTQTSNNGFSPLQQAQQEISMNLMDYYNRKAPGSSYAALSSTKLKQRDDADEYNQKLIKRRNTGIEALMKIPSSKRAKAYPKLIEMLRGQGADVGMPEKYDEETLSLMKGKDSDWAAKENLKFMHKMQLQAMKPQKDAYQEALAKKSAGENVDLASGVAEIKSTLPGIEASLNKALSLVDKVSPSWDASAGSYLSKRIRGKDTEQGRAMKQLQTITDSISNLKLRSTLGSAFTEREGLALKAILMDPDTDSETKKANILNWLERNKADIAAKEMQLSEFAKGTGYGIPSNFTPTEKITKTGTTGKTDYKSKYGLD